MKYTIFLFNLFFCLTVFSQCPIPPNSFIGVYDINQVTPIHPENGVHSFNDLQVNLFPGQNDNERFFEAVYLKDLGLNQGQMVISFTLDCNNGNQVIVDSNLDTLLSCDGLTPITLGPDISVGTFDPSDDSSFNLILQEYVNDGACGIPSPLTTEFTLTKTSCLAPENVAVSNVTSTTADVSWNDSNSGSSTYDIEYGLEGFSQGSGTTILGLTSTSTQLTGLQNDLSYDLYINTVCATNESVSIGPITFPISTTCANQYSDFPVLEDFSNAFFLFECHESIDQDGNGNDWGQQTVQLSPDVSSNFAINGVNTSQKEDYLFTPGIFMESGKSYEINFNYNAVNAQNSIANEGLEVTIGRGTTVNDFNLGTFIMSAAGISQNGSFSEIESLAYSHNSQFIPNSDGYYYLAFKSNGAPLPTQTATGFLVIFDYSIGETLSTDSFQELDFKYFVDNSEVLNIYASQPLNEVKVYDLSGKNILNKKVSRPNERLDISYLNRGIYIIKVNVQNKMKTFKIIKN